jgi:hypothetical protein
MVKAYFPQRNEKSCYFIHYAFEIFFGEGIAPMASEIC